MKLLEGRIGRQESVCILTETIASLCILNMHGQRAYANGNTTYVWVPAGVLLACACALFVLWVMQKTRQKDLPGLYQSALGRFLGGAALLVIAIALLWYCGSLLNNFLSAMHSYIFPAVRYSPVIFWVVLAVAYIAWGGMERIGRTAKCVSAIVGFTLLLTLLLPAKAYQLYRLFPFPGDAPLAIVQNGIYSFIGILPVALLTLSFSGVLQGEGSIRLTLLLAASASAILIMLVQLALGLIFTSEQLIDMNMPLFRINMNLLSNAYYLRQDKVSVFIWLMAAVPGGAYLLYGFAYLICRAMGGQNIRPALCSGTALLICILLLRREALFGFFEAVQEWIWRYGGLAIWPPLLAVCIFQGAKLLRKGGVRHDA